MTPKHVVAVGLRLFALWLVWGSVQLFAIASVLKRYNPQLGDNPLWMAVLVMAAFLVAAFLIWIFSAPLATAALSGVPKPQDTRLSLNHIIVAGCVLMGLWWLKESSIPLLGLWLRAIATARLNDVSAFGLLGDTGKINTALYLVQMACGLFFVLRPFVIVRWVIRSSSDVFAEPTAPQQVEGGK